ncbi:hypothetical protein EPH_0020060 [Eimeria praecox]|uniref:Uncharacterized protein n=1 Tax=Eimeria praecox TaxID=51316 RepID=U6H1I7_9EIME|nr:hypothetical protein EPH_0020060 [Eimeria praecox]
MAASLGLERIEGSGWCCKHLPHAAPKDSTGLERIEGSGWLTANEHYTCVIRMVILDGASLSNVMNVYAPAAVGDACLHGAGNKNIAALCTDGIAHVPPNMLEKDKPLRANLQGDEQINERLCNANSVNVGGALGCVQPRAFLAAELFW